MGRMARAVVIVASLVLAGCASQQDAPATDAARGFVAALERGDTGTACAALAPDTEQSLTSAGERCDAELATLDLPTGAVRDTSVWADRAQVRTDGDTLFLVELAGGWRVAAAGCVHQPDDTYECLLSRA